MTEQQFISIVATAFLAVLGACAGSFINAASLRRAEGLSFITGRSHCPSCKRDLRWFELIPIISYIIQAGRCRTCKERIPPRYMLVEVIGATASALCYIRYSFTLHTLIFFGAALILLAVSMFDLTMMKLPDGEIPDSLFIALIPFAIAAALVTQFAPGQSVPLFTSAAPPLPDVSLLSRGIGLIVVSVPMLVLALVINGAFGGADIKLMAVCGALLGWQNTLLAFFIAVLTAGSVSLTLIATKSVKKGAKLIFCPHLCFGVFIAMLYGENIINWYLKLYGL